MTSDSSAFISVRDYWTFRSHVVRQRRYFRTAEAEQFLMSVKATVTSRILELPENWTAWRARIGHSMRYEPQIEEELPTALGSDGMKPLRDRASEGRVNPKGLPCLYVASNARTALSEVRPWLGALVTVSSLRITRPLRIVDCSHRHSPTRIYLKEPDVAGRIEAVWADINSAFSEPATRDESTADYVPTQILAELFRDLGYDGVVYRSAFGEDGFNIALFDLDAAEVQSCVLKEVTQMTYDDRALENPWFVTDEGLVRNVITDIQPIPKSQDASNEVGKI